MIFKILITSLTLLSHVALQGQLSINGTITDSNQNQLINHPVFIKADQAIIDTVYTVKDGKYLWTTNNQDYEKIIIQTVGFCGEWETYSDTLQLSTLTNQENNFTICHQETNESCVANIAYENETNGLISFNADYRTKEYVNYFWDFGDGFTSTLSSPKHEFATEGVFTVKLIVTTPLGCKDTAYTEVLASEKSFIRGTLSIPENYLSNAYIWVIGFNSNQNTIIQTIYPNNTGQYQFFCEANSQYILKVVPNFIVQTFPKVLPTYYGNTINWQDAAVIAIEHEIKNVDLATKVSYTYLHGFNTINGYFEYSVSPNGLPLNVLLLDKNENAIDHALVKDGRFNFDGLPRGTYYVKPECVGKISKATQIDFNEDFDVPKRIEYIVSTTKITPVGIYNTIVKNKLSVYPNPFKETLNVEYNSAIKLIQIVDLNGKVIHEWNGLNLLKTTINTSSIPKGGYIIKATPINLPPVYQLLTK